jgi:ribonuclease-3
MELSSARRNVLAVFQKTVGIKFRNLEFLDLSLTHSSVSNESSRPGNNERLEFLGDAILGAVTAARLYTEFPDKAEGELAKIKSVVVSEETLAGVALELQLDGLLLLGRGEDLSGGRKKKAILADALEALIGALYLDSGYKTAADFVVRCMDPEIRRVAQRRHYQDYKSLLQELSQQRFRTCPVYILIKRSGPEHSQFFWIDVRVNGHSFGPGMGKSKKTAEQEAAKLAYNAIMNETETPGSLLHL